MAIERPFRSPSGRIIGREVIGYLQAQDSQPLGEPWRVEWLIGRFSLSEAAMANDPDAESDDFVHRLRQSRRSGSVQIVKQSIERAG
jgi:hypothetical protein